MSNRQTIIFSHVYPRSIIVDPSAQEGVASWLCALLSAGSVAKSAAPRVFFLGLFATPEGCVGSGPCPGGPASISSPVSGGFCGEESGEMPAWRFRRRSHPSNNLMSLLLLNTPPSP